MKTKQHTLWLLAALAAPIAHYSSSGWLMSAAAALAVLPLTRIPKSWEGLTRGMAFGHILWLGVVAGFLLPGSAACWPSEQDRAVPLTLLTLAATTRPNRTARVGAVLAFCMALLAIPLAVSGASGVELRWLGPELMPWPVGLTLVLLLPNLPSAGEGTRGIPGTALLTLALSALVQGSISLKVASTTGSPIYEAARTLGHLEPVTAAALTLGWYALASLFLDSAARIAQEGDIRMEVAYVLLWCTAAVFVLFGLQPNTWFVTVLSLFWWVITPFFQKMKKLENSA